MSFLYLFVFVLLSGCGGTSDNNTAVNEQGIFEFPNELFDDDRDDVPDYLDEEAILCNGKGLKVAKCISNQLKKGICLGIIKHEKRVYAVEIPCATVKEMPRDTLEGVAL